MAKDVLPKEFPAFGLLNHIIGTNWSSNGTISFLGKNWSIPISVSIGTCGLEHNQLAARMAFEADSDDIIAKSEGAILKHIHSEIEHPELRHRQELDGLVTPVGIHFPRARSRPTWGILLDCTWDDRGVAVEVVDSEITRVGFQDIVL